MEIRRAPGARTLTTLWTGFVLACVPCMSGLAWSADSTTPAGRPSLVVLAQPLWSELTAGQQQILAELEPQWNSLPATKKRSWLTLADKLPRMSPAEREKAETRIREWAQLTPEQRRQARNNYRLAKSLPRDARVATWEQYQQMTSEQQSVLRHDGWTSNTAARHAGAPTGLAKQAARPIPGVMPPAPKNGQSATVPPASAPHKPVGNAKSGTDR